MLVVTFTNAAASEMRQRILDAIYKKLEEDPENEHLQKQTTLISKSNISTIHSFCLEVIKNNFYTIDISPNFTIGDTTQIELLKQEVLETIFEQKYEEGDKEFINLINTYTDYRGDDELKEIILKIYRYIQSSPFPNEWLEDQIEKFNLADKIEEDFSNTIWGKLLLKKFKDELDSYILELNQIKNELTKEPELEKYYNTICTDIEMLNAVRDNTVSWDKAYEVANPFKFVTWPIDKKINSQLKEQAKEERDVVRNNFYKLRSKIFTCNSKQANEDIYSMYAVLKEIQKLIIEFDAEFSKQKKERNIVDFNDIEHFALKILVKQDENKNAIPTEVAKQYREKFDEIAIDEYQDSNLVQEQILSSISRGNNIFMVGDVKQSIYKFRQARPELFINKYESYKLKENLEENDNLKIQLFKNFRSRQNILDVTNTIFENIMSKELGDIKYNKDEFLNLGANYEEPAETISYAGKAELHIINVENNSEEQQEESEQEQEEQERIENIVLEAKFVAKQIQKLLNSGYKVYDKNKGYRDITYKDIVVLLRSTAILAPIYEREISSLNIPVFSDTSSQYLESTEIQTIMSLLKIIDNPRQDIPLVAIMRSMIGGFDDNELVEIKLAGDKLEKQDSSNNYQKGFYDVMLSSINDVKEQTKAKIERLLSNLNTWREEQEYLALDELIWKIYTDTGYYHYVGLMTNGAFRQANLKMLFEKAKQYEGANFKGLFNFIIFIDKLKSSNNDMSAAKLIGENEDVVRLMSIHKSKGLEFPVVFLAGAGKKFNLQDLNDNILLHQDLGIGPKYIDYERRIEYNTLAKEAISYKTKLETLSEEMRILYVALTRAKEKLIITGIMKKTEDLEKKEKILSVYNEEKISPNILSKYTSYLDWIELVYLNNKKVMGDIIDLQIHENGEVLQEVRKEDKEEAVNKLEDINNKISDIKVTDEVRDQIYWKYEYEQAINLPTKTSVTKIKELQNSINSKKQKAKVKSKPIEHSEMTIPKFMQEEVEISNSRKGSLMHLCIQRMNEKEHYTMQTIDKLVEELVEKNIILQKEADAINKDALLEYTKSPLFQELSKAKQVYKEQPFYIYIPAEEIYNEGETLKPLNEKILVQGIIDLYYINQNDEIILVDYKTDYVQEGEENEKELVEKYRKQLELYKKAIEISTNKNVAKSYIYSIYLQKELPISN